jgi:hypothetical protein
VGRILLYRLVTDKGERSLLIHLTSGGLITDYDIVEESATTGRAGGMRKAP